MNHKINYISQDEINSITAFRKGETKFGEKIQIIDPNYTLEENLKKTSAKFVVLGLTESVGVKANFGRTGTETAFENTLKSLLNIQHNKLLKGNNVLIIGELDVFEIQQKAMNLNPNIEEDLYALRELVKEIDKEVAHIVFTIAKCKKIPIIIGGGHNNSYGIIKGMALAKGDAINTINFDAHTDFRPLEGRHSGNGFSYAYNEGFLEKYFIFGIHENYTSKKIYHNLKKHKDKIQYISYEDIKITCKTTFEKEMLRAVQFIRERTFGIELDLDSVVSLPSSAMSLSGFSAEEMRRFVWLMGNESKAGYLHICEGAPSLGDQKNPNLVGKLITYLITDFIKAKLG
ncbi:MAG: formimidoylglutamase [Bacteroidota bacterium]|nr:formimidoylglutamase [Bacteroidota bacterium]